MSSAFDSLMQVELVPGASAIASRQAFFFPPWSAGPVHAPPLWLFGQLRHLLRQLHEPRWGAVKRERANRVQNAVVMDSGCAATSQVGVAVAALARLGLSISRKSSPGCCSQLSDNARAAQASAAEPHPLMAQIHFQNRDAQPQTRLETRGQALMAQPGPREQASSALITPSRGSSTVTG